MGFPILLRWHLYIKSGPRSLCVWDLIPSAGNNKTPAQLPRPRVILWMRPANKRRSYIVTLSLIGWMHARKDPWRQMGWLLSLWVYLTDKHHAHDPVSMVKSGHCGNIQFISHKICMVLFWFVCVLYFQYLMESYGWFNHDLNELMLTSQIFSPLTNVSQGL